MAEKLNEFINALQNASDHGEALIIPPDEVSLLLHDLRQVNHTLLRFSKVMVLQVKALDRANQVFKKANHWPDYQYPDLSVLINWIFDQSGRRQAAMFQSAVEDVLTTLSEIGPVEWDQAVTISGLLIQMVRSRLAAVLGAVHEQNMAFQFRAHQSCTLYFGEEDENHACGTE